MEASGGQIMGKVIEAILVTKQEQLPKLDPGPIHILLGANLRIKDKNEGKKNEER